MKSILVVLILSTIANAGLFQEEVKKLHMQVSVTIGGMGDMMCIGEGGGVGLQGWEAILCGTALGMIPGIIKEASDEHNYGGWDNRDLGADLIGSFIGAVGTVTIWEFNSGDW